MSFETIVIQLLLVFVSSTVLNKKVSWKFIKPWSCHFILPSPILHYSKQPIRKCVTASMDVNKSFTISKFFANISSHHDFISRIKGLL